MTKITGGAFFSSSLRNMYNGNHGGGGDLLPPNDGDGGDERAFAGFSNVQAMYG